MNANPFLMINYPLVELTLAAMASSLAVAQCLQRGGVEMLSAWRREGVDFVRYYTCSGESVQL